MQLESIPFNILINQIFQDVVLISKIEVEDEFVLSKSPSREAAEDDHPEENNCRTALGEVPSEKENDNWDCPVCLTQLPVNLPLKDHLQTHFIDSEQEPKCPICGQLFNRLSKIYSHILSRHKNGKEEEIEETEMGPDGSDDDEEDKDYIKEEEMDQDSEEYDKEGENEKEMVKPREKNHSRRISPISKTLDDQRKSSTTVTSKCQSNFQCKICKMHFSCKYNLDLHWRRLHSKERPFQCTTSMCDKSFATKGDRNRHEILFHSEEEPFKCSSCDRTFSEKRHRNRHEIAYHCKERPFKCEKCNDAFARSDLLRKHQLTHERATDGERRKCKICGRNVDNWKQHKRQHAGKEKGFACKKCPKIFDVAYELRLHTTIYHAQAKDRYKCPECEKIFQRPADMKRHLGTRHSTERPFACKLCDCRFKRADILKPHMELVHKVKG